MRFKKALVFWSATTGAGVELLSYPGMRLALIFKYSTPAPQAQRGALETPFPKRKKPRRNEAFRPAAYKQPNLGSGGVICTVPTALVRIRLG